MTSIVKTSTALWLGLLAGLVLTIAACGGDDDDDGASPTIVPSPATEAAYFDLLAPALQAVNAQLEDLDQLRAAAFDDGPDPAATDAYGAAYERFASERLAAIEALRPNETLADKHQALADAARDGLLLGEELRAELNQSPPASDAEFLTLFGDLDGATITSRYLDACTALQSSATSGGLAVDLQCLL